MSEVFLHNLAVTAFYAVTWLGGLSLFVGFGLNGIDGPYSVPTRITVAAAITGVLLLLVGITGAASGLEWDVAR